MIRQATPPDPALMFAPLSVPPVVTPRRRLKIEPPVAAEPELAEAIAAKRAEIEQRDPGVAQWAYAAVPEPEPAVVPEAARRAGAVEHPPRVSADGDAVLWAPPVPTFTYLAGAAGSGKTFATKAWNEREKGLLLCATTGIAAVNLGGETLHATVGYFDSASMQEKYITGFLTAQLGRLWRAGVKRLVVDEVSMLPADQLTYLVKAIEEVNQRGYVLTKWAKDPDEDDAPPAMGLTLVGDFLQLSPVKAPFAFESPEWERFTPNILTLTEIRRQADPEFIEMLRAARRGDSAVVVDYFQSRNAIQQETHDEFDGPTIVAKNDSVDRFNFLRMSRLTGTEITFASSRWGKQRSEWGHPDKPPNTWGIPHELSLKVGALVMVLANERNAFNKLMYVNGDLATVVDAENGTALVELQRTREVVTVGPVTRQVKVPIDSARRKELREKGLAQRIDGKWEVIGEISYLPLRVAYASTVHKSQGLSLDKVQVNIRDAFFRTPGMLYVALSRARTAEGLRVVGSPAALRDRCTVNPRLRNWL